ncbi:MAG: trimeric autotransporter adhesin [Acidimicrobiaceae bacterium]|jgi:plastocyanin
MRRTGDWQRRSARGAVVTLLFAAVAVAGVTAPAWAATASCQAGDVQVSVKNNFYTPTPVNITAGQTVCWVWSETTVRAHTVTADSNAFDSGSLTPPNGRFRQTFPTNGTNPYHCTFHGAAGGTGMAGVVQVGGGGGGGVTVTSVKPVSRGQGATKQKVTITGTGFVSGATTTVSGTGVTVTGTTFVSATTVVAVVNVATSATVGPRNVTVTLPSSASASCTNCFTVVVGPKPTGLSPPSGARGAAVNATISGTGFQNGAVVTVGKGVAVSNVVLVNSTTITATFTIDAATTTGVRSVIVVNKDKGKGTCANCFNVT